MAHYEWELTDEEKKKCEHLGYSVSDYQEAKKKAFIKNGGVILNPDSLYDMYEALEDIRDGVVNNQERIGHDRFEKLIKALNKANGKGK